MNETKWEHCGRAYFYAPTIGGGYFALNAQPSAAGQYVIRDGFVRALREGELPKEGERCYMNHFKTCDRPMPQKDWEQKGLTGQPGQWERVLYQKEELRRRRAQGANKPAPKPATKGKRRAS